MNLDEKEWIVVHFIDEDMVEAVPRVWYMFEYNMCSWPPMNFRRFLPDLIKKKEIPEDFQAKILGQYDDFQMAKRKALKAQDTMDLSSNNDIPITKMRHFKHIQKNKFLSSDSENDKDEDDDDENIYPSMPIKNLATQLNTNKKFGYSCSNASQQFPEVSYTLSIHPLKYCPKNVIVNLNLEFFQPVVTRKNYNSTSTSLQKLMGMDQV
ncbi:unnamed protein product [Callosobruchus maculatus]|uniref:Uncharacterized protein n=1 Tax=Callosobruchus maculatus TaxID=64391 RepID=A0A653CRE4_CALMS|nr:unnamed protein product [Callosobruchus maculatus]